ncbi:MCE family protein [Apibacter muscae]|nr:MCE family protein [Apibacter muscae]
MIQVKIKKEFKAGVIVIVTLLCFWWLFQFLKGKDVFSSQKIYYVKYNKLEGLSKSKSVYINGLKVGMVESIESIPTKNNNISFVVGLSIDKEFSFSKNSVAEIQNSLMSGAEIHLELSEDGPIAQPGDTLKGIIIPGIMDVAGNELKPLSKNVNSVLLRLDSTLTATNKLLSNRNINTVEASLDNLNRTIAQFNQLGKSMNSLLSQNSAALTTALTNVNTMLISTNKTVSQYGSLAEKINQSDFEKTIKNLESTLSNVNQLTAKINSGEGSLGKLMNDKQLYTNLENASKNLNLLLVDFRENPKRYVHFSVFGGGNKNKKNKKVDSTAQALN